MNAKEEFIEHTQGKTIICAFVEAEDSKPFVLKAGYTPSDYDTFLQSLDFIYDAGWGHQELGGVIWYDDGTWSNHEGCDGAEWWSYNSAPRVPDFCKTVST